MRKIITVSMAFLLLIGFLGAIEVSNEVEWLISREEVHAIFGPADVVMPGAVVIAVPTIFENSSAPMFMTFYFYDGMLLGIGLMTDDDVMDQYVESNGDKLGELQFETSNQYIFRGNDSITKISRTETGGTFILTYHKYGYSGLTTIWKSWGIEIASY